MDYLDRERQEFLEEVAVKTRNLELQTVVVKDARGRRQLGWKTHPLAVSPDPATHCVQYLDGGLDCKHRYRPRVRNCLLVKCPHVRRDNVVDPRSTAPDESNNDEQ